MKEKKVGGERQGEGAQGSRRGAVSFKRSGIYNVRFAVQKVLRIHFMLMVKQVSASKQHG